MQTVIVQKGKNNFRPEDSGLPFCVRPVERLSIVYRFHPSCLYDIRPDRDWKDWNKLAGLSFHAFPKNKDNLIIAWRSRPERQQIELAFFANKDGDFTVGEGRLFVDPLRTGQAVINRQSGRDWTIMIGEEIAESYRTRKEFKGYGSRITPWFGGANNSPGPYGGAAPQEMSLAYTMIVRK